MDTTTNLTLKRCFNGDKCCHKNGCMQPATTEYFSLEKGKLRGVCRACRNMTRVRKYGSDNAYAEKVRTRNNKTRENPDIRDRYKQNAKQRRLETKDEINARARAWRLNNPALREEENAKRRLRYKEDQGYREQCRKSAREQRVKNAEKIKQANKDWRSRNRATLIEKKKAYYYSHYKFVARERAKEPEIIARRRAYDLNRAARKKNLPNTLTKAQFKRCLQWWEYRCAYCGQHESVKGVLQADHFIPLTAGDCPGTTAQNIVPACKSCNVSKNDSRPEKWVVLQFSKEKSAAILSRITLYFETQA